MLCGVTFVCVLRRKTPSQSYLGASEETPPIVAEYFARRAAAAGAGGSGASGSSGGAGGVGLAVPASLSDGGRAYVKPPAEAPAPTGASAAAAAARRAPPAPVDDAADASAPPPKGRARKAAAAAAAAASAALAPPPPASWRGRVVNCVACGRIHDCRGADAGGDAMRAFLTHNACLYCGAHVAPPTADASSSSGDAAAAGSAVPATPAQNAPPPPQADAATEAATAAAARLVEFDRTFAQRTRVIDDQSDYIEFECNAWLSASEKASLRAAAAEADAAAAAEKRRVRITLDLVGRRVLAAPAVGAGEEGGARMETGGGGGADGATAADAHADADAALASRADAVRPCFVCLCVRALLHARTCADCATPLLSVQARAAADATAAHAPHGGGRAAAGARAFADALDAARVMAPCPSATRAPLFVAEPKKMTKTAADKRAGAAGNAKQAGGAQQQQQKGGGDAGAGKGGAAGASQPQPQPQPQPRARPRPQLCRVQHGELYADVAHAADTDKA